MKATAHAYWHALAAHAVTLEHSAVALHTALMHAFPTGYVRYTHTAEGWYCDLEMDGTRKRSLHVVGPFDWWGAALSTAVQRWLATIPPT